MNERKVEDGRDRCRGLALPRFVMPAVWSSVTSKHIATAYSIRLNIVASLHVFTTTKETGSGMAGALPYRDINVHSSPSHYAFSSPSSPSAPTLVVDRPSGDIRLHDGKMLGSKRVSSIAGILGIIKLRLGM
jgi:hypothetical protein